MRCFSRGVLLGTFVILCLLFLQIETKHSDPYFEVVTPQSQYCSAQTTEPEKSSWKDNFSLTCKSNSYPDSFFYYDYVPLTYFDIVRSNIKNNDFCQWRYDLTSDQIRKILKLDYAYIVAVLLKLDHLTNYGIAELWCLYKESCKKAGKVKKCEKDLLAKLQDRAKRFKQQTVQKQQEEQGQKVLELQKKKEEQKLQEIYHSKLLISYGYESSYHDARKQALEQSQKQHYRKYEQSRELDEQTIKLCIAKNIDYQKLQQCTGTAIQHQLYDEVADCYKKIARFFCQPTLAESILASQSLEFAQCVVGATELEAMELAIALSDMAHCCVNTVSWILSETKEAVCNFAKMIKNDPACIVKDLGYCFGKVMNYVAQAMLHADSEGLGWSCYARVLEQEHQYDAEYAQQVTNALKSWIENSSGQEKIRATTRFAVESVLYGAYFKVLSHAGKSCCRLIADIPEIRYVENFADVYVEHGLATELGKVGLQSMEDLGMSLLKSEIDSFGKNGTKIASRVVVGNKKRIYTDVDFHHQNSSGGHAGGKSRSPKDGQKTLDNSIPFKIKGNKKYERRIGVEEDYFVILDEHSPGEFHGHIRTWEGLEGEAGDEIRNALYKAGIVKNRKTGRM